MTEARPKLSIVIATYQPREGLDRVIGSLDQQTLAQDEFEVIFVDDGSPDDTYARLQQLEAERANVRVFRIENSGWPSRPRNIGISKARGEYVMFMDHDDSLFPDGLRRACEYAAETGADLLSPKESKTNDIWWAMPAQVEGNIENVRGGSGIEMLLPMVPHKIYRRQLLLDHDLRFPEGARILWEDIYINVGAYRHAKVVSVLADTPVYLWHASDTNSSHTFNPARRDFWDRLEDVMSYIDKTLDIPELSDDHAHALAHQLQSRVIDRMVRYQQRSHKPGVSGLRRMLPVLWHSLRNPWRLHAEHAWQRAFRRSRKLLKKFGSPTVLAALPRKHQVQAALLSQGLRDQMIEVREWDRTADPETTVTAMRWDGSRLRLDIETVWCAQEGEPAVLRRVGDRVALAVPGRVEAAVSRELLDVTAALDSEFGMEAIVREAGEYVSWNVPISDVSARFEEVQGRGLGIVATASLVLDAATAAGGMPLGASVWDLRVKTMWAGMSRRRGLSYRGPVRAALVGGRPVVAYGNDNGSAALDLSGERRTFVTDAGPRGGAIGTVESFSTRLTNVVTDDDAFLVIDDLAVVPIPDVGGPGKSPARAAEQDATAIEARVVVEDGVATLSGRVPVGQGRYRVYARRGGALRRTRHSLRVDGEGQLDWKVERR